MEELIQLCNDGASTIALCCSWSDFDDAKQLLERNGYAEEEQDVDEADDVCFVVKAQLLQDSKRSKVSFPEEIPEPVYKPERNAAAADADGWRPCIALQLNTASMPPSKQIRLQARIPGTALDRSQTVGIKLCIQPFVKLDAAQFYAKLRVETLIVGVHVKDLDLSASRTSLGYYPSYVRITLDPEIGAAAAIPTIEASSMLPPSPPPPSQRNTSTTTIGGRLGYGPASIEMTQSWEVEWSTGGERTSLVHVPCVDDHGNAAIFDWCILRWANGASYEMSKPHAVLRRTRSQLPGLPFEGRSAAARLAGFPDVVWKFQRSAAAAPLKFWLRIEVQMQLVWFLGSNPLWFRSIGSDTSSFSYQHWLLVDHTLA